MQSCFLCTTTPHSVESDVRAIVWVSLHERVRPCFLSCTTPHSVESMMYVHMAVWASEGVGVFLVREV